jgi:hypothetical protein
VDKEQVIYQFTTSKEVLVDLVARDDQGWFSLIPMPYKCLVKPGEIIRLVRVKPNAGPTFTVDFRIS